MACATTSESLVAASFKLLQGSDLTDYSITDKLFTISQAVSGGDGIVMDPITFLVCVLSNSYALRLFRFFTWNVVWFGVYLFDRHE